MLETILIAVVSTIVVLFAALLIFASTRPDTFRVERSTTINTAPDKVFPHVNDFHKWIAWSPWEGIDPNLQRTYDGPPEGTGTSYAWNGNKRVGQGKMAITASEPPARIAIQLDFIRPFEAHNNVEFTFMRQGDATVVSWAMNGRQPFLLKVMSVFMSMDSMVGKDFEKGLAALKKVAEG